MRKRQNSQNTSPPKNPKSKIHNHQSPIPLPTPSTPPENHQPQPSPSLLRLHTRQTRPLDWLFPNRIPLGKITLLIGDPDSGKSFLALDLAARVSRGQGLPSEPGLGQPASVLLLCADDDLDDTLLPRLEAADADLSRIALLPSLVESDSHDDDHASRLLSLAHDLHRLHTALDQLPDCRLIVIDPISAYLRGVDGNNNITVRQVLLELATLARDRHAAILLVSHQRKQWSSSALYRAIGSLAFTAVARVVLMLTEDPATRGRRLLLPVKMTLQPTAPGRAFRIENALPPKTSPPSKPKKAQGLQPLGLPAGKLIWDNEDIPFTADELQHLAQTGLASSDRRKETADWLKAELMDGRLPSEEIQRRAAQRDIPVKLLWTAKKDARIEAVRDGKNRRWYWELPQPWHNALLWNPDAPIP